MNHPTYYISRCLLVALLLSIFGVHIALAAGVSISGSYEVIEKTDLGSQMKVVVRFHLTNLGQEPVSLRGLVLSDFAYPHTQASHSGAVTLSPGTTADITQEFTIPRAEFDQWHRGLRPRVILELKTATGAGITQPVRLEHALAKKGE